MWVDGNEVSEWISITPGNTRPYSCYAEKLGNSSILSESTWFDCDQSLLTGFQICEIKGITPAQSVAHKSRF